jgi:hypothetical protein
MSMSVQGRYYSAHYTYSEVRNQRKVILNPFPPNGNECGRENGRPELPWFSRPGKGQNWRCTHHRE